MSSRRLRWANVLILLALALATVLIWQLVLHNRDPATRVEEISGLSLPEDARLIHHEEEWDGWFGDGHSLWVFSLPEEYGRPMLDRCGSYGYTFGRLVDQDIRYPSLEEHIAADEDACFLLPTPGKEWRAVVITPTRLGVYNAFP